MGTSESCGIRVRTATFSRQTGPSPAVARRSESSYRRRDGHTERSAIPPRSEQRVVLRRAGGDSYNATNAPAQTPTERGWSTSARHRPSRRSSSAASSWSRSWWCAIMLIAVAGQQLPGQRPQQRAEGLQQQRRVAEPAVGQDRRELLQRCSSGASERPTALQTSSNQSAADAADRAQRGEGHRASPMRSRAPSRTSCSALQMRADGIQNIAGQVQPALQSPDEQGRGQHDRGRHGALLRLRRPLQELHRAADHRRAARRPTSPWAARAASRSTRASSCLDRLAGSARRSPTSSTSRSQPRTQRKSRPGVHGHAMNSVSVGGTTLQTGSTNTIPASPPPTFTLHFTNDGQNTETNVVVKVTVQGTSISGQATVPQTTPASTYTAQVTLTSSPAQGHLHRQGDDREGPGRDDHHPQHADVPGHLPVGARAAAVARRARRDRILSPSARPDQHGGNRRDGRRRRRDRGPPLLRRPGPQAAPPPRGPAHASSATASRTSSRTRPRFRSSSRRCTATSRTPPSGSTAG